MATTEATKVPGGYGKAVRLDQGRSLRIVNTHGSQVVDFWAFNTADTAEHLSMLHTRSAHYRMHFRPGDALLTNRRRPILSFVEDTSPGVHDSLIACCDPVRYEQLGHPGHRSCAQNLAEAMAELGLKAPPPPAPYNLFMNIPWAADGGLAIAAPTSQPGDRVTFRAEMDCIAVMSACPHDIFPINGPDLKPRDVAYALLG